MFGQKLFFDTRFGSNGKVACPTCHLPDQLFQDGAPLASGVRTTSRRTKTIPGIAYSPWLFWDGRKDSQWAQAPGPMENPIEHGGNRSLYAHLIAEFYSDEYTALFGPLRNLSNLPLNASPVTDPEVERLWCEARGLSREMQKTAPMLQAIVDIANVQAKHREYKDALVKMPVRASGRGASIALPG